MMLFLFPFLRPTQRRFISTQAQLYRVLLRQCRAWDDIHIIIWLQSPPHATSSSARLFPLKTASVRDVYQWLVQQRDPEWKAWYQDLNLDHTDTDDDDDDDDEPVDASLSTTVTTLQQALRTAFTKTSSTHYTSLAIRAFRYLREQPLVTVSNNIDHGICIRVVSYYYCDDERRSSLEHPKYRFVYRIRIERVDDTDSTTAVQLLGRTWHIQDGNDDDEIVVNAPTTGAVGQLPVLGPRTCFEYTSGVELSSRSGRMWGRFHFAYVPVGTPSAVVGMAVPALSADNNNNNNNNNNNKFSVEVKPFPLCVEDNDDNGSRRVR